MIKVDISNMQTTRSTNPNTNRKQLVYGSLTAKNQPAIEKAKTEIHLFDEIVKLAKSLNTNVKSEKDVALVVGILAKQINNGTVKFVNSDNKSK